MAHGRLTLVLAALVLAGCASLDTDYAQGGYAAPAGYGYNGYSSYGGPAYAFNPGGYYAGGPVPGYYPAQPWYGRAPHPYPGDRRWAYHGEHDQAALARDRAYHEQRAAQQQQLSQQLRSQQQQYNQQLSAAQQRYNQQVAAQPRAEPIYRQQLQQQATGLQQQLTDHSRYLRQALPGQ